MNQKEEINKALEIMKDWDFSLTVKKVTDSDSEKWSSDRALKAVEDYKKYLAVTKALNGYQLVPNAEIDEIWHFHLTDTRRYIKDCHELFGGFLHHYPFYGMLNDENKSDWLDNQRYSDDFWFNAFGEKLYSKSNQGQKCPQACPCNINGHQNSGLDYNYGLT